ncbi:MAG: FtsX-like permease family protein [Bacteroidota bacterium]
MLESILFALLGSFLALGIVQLVLPSFGSLLDKPYLFSNVEPWPIVAAFFTIGLLSGILAGIYPAAILSKKKIIYALKGKPPRGKGQRLRKVLLIGQFVIAIFFLVCTAIVSEQISYFLNKDIGYNGDNVLIISSLPRTYSNAGVAKMIDLKNRFLSHPSVDKAALSYEIPDGRRGQDTEIKPVGKEEYLYFPLISTDEQYFATYDIPIIEGRRYRDDDYSKNRILLNETAARELFGEESAIGKQVNLRNRPDQEVIGIVSDFNFGSLHTAIQGIVFMHTLDVNLYRYYSFKLKPDDINQTVDELTAIWREVFPKAPFVYFFMDDKLDELYKAEDQFKRTLFIASIFALGIVLIGLFGTTLQSLSERTKEIGVRKTLGASISNLWLMLLKSYAIILIISSIIAFPLAYFAMDKWLQNYAYRISQSPAIYIVGFGLILLLTLLTIGYQIWKASRANPVDSLRYE